MFDTLEKFVVRFEAVSKEAEEARRFAASQSARTAAAAAAAHRLASAKDGTGERGTRV